jgi:hypothetical protein
MRMQGQLQKAVNNGTVKADDQDALSSALSDISAQLQANAAGSTGTPAPGGMKSTIDGLISGEVSSGKLTEDQAGELKSVFAQAAQKMHGHHRHGMGRGGGADSDGDSDDASTDPITGAPAAATTSFADFLQKLETSLADSINGVAGTSASTDGTSATGSTQSTTAAAATGAASDPRQLMLSFLQKLETAMGGGNTYSPTGASGAANTQAVLVNALA